MQNTLNAQSARRFWGKRTRAQKLAILILVAAVLWIASGAFSKHNTDQQQAANSIVKRVTIEPVKIVAHKPRLNITGRTEAEKRVDITAQTAGQIEAIPFPKGSSVKEGDVILRFKSDGRASAVEDAKSLLKQREADLRGQEQLFAQSFTSRKTMSEFQTAYATAKTNYERALAEQDRAVVRAPFAGLLNDVPLDISQAVKQGDKIATVMILNPLKILGEVSERVVARIAAGQKLSVISSSGEELNGTLTYVSRSAEPLTRTFRVEASIENPELRIPEGASVTVAIQMAEAPAANIRRSALTLNEKGVVGVRIVDSANKVKFVPITIVDDMPESFWVTGIEDGAKLITVGQDFVIDGEMVEGVESKQ